MEISTTTENIKGNTIEHGFEKHFEVIILKFPKNSFHGRLKFEFFAKSCTSTFYIFTKLTLCKYNQVLTPNCPMNVIIVAIEFNIIHTYPPILLTKNGD